MPLRNFIDGHQSLVGAILSVFLLFDGISGERKIRHCHRDLNIKRMFKHIKTYRVRRKVPALPVITKRKPGAGQLTCSITNRVIKQVQ
jgi:hypothetical protein